MAGNSASSERRAERAEREQSMPLSKWMPLLVVAVAIPAAARAQDTAILTAPKAFALAEAYQKAGREADAEALLKALSQDPNADYRAEARFRLGEALMARRDYAGAIDAFSALLEQKPDAKAARIELAKALALGGKPAAAERQLRRAEAGGLPPDVQRLVDKFGDVLRRSRPYGASFELGIAPDSNINQATDVRTVDIGGFPLTLDESGRAKSGIGLLASGDAFASLPLAHGVALVTNIAGTGNFYRSGRFTDLFVTASSGPEFVIDREVIRAAATYAWRQVGKSTYSKGYGGSLQMTGPAGKAGQFGFTLSLSQQRYRIPDQNGLQFAARASLERALSSRLFGRIELNVARQEAVAAPYASWSYGIAGSLSRDVGALTVYGSAAYSRTEGDAPFALFGAGRHDNRLDVSIGAGWKHFSVAGLSPVVRVSQTINRSPLAIYKFRRTRLELALAERF